MSPYRPQYRGKFSARFFGIQARITEEGIHGSALSNHQGEKKCSGGPLLSGGLEGKEDESINPRITLVGSRGKVHSKNPEDLPTLSEGFPLEEKGYPAKNIGRGK